MKPHIIIDQRVYNNLKLRSDLQGPDHISWTVKFGVWAITLYYKCTTNFDLDISSNCCHISKVKVTLHAKSSLYLMNYILEYPFFAHLRRNTPWQRQPCANWKTYLTIIYDTNVSFKGTMHFVNLFPFPIFLPGITPGRFHFALMTSYPIIVHQDWRGSKLGKVY